VQLRKRLKKTVGRWWPGMMPGWARSNRLRRYVRDHRHVEGYFDKKDLLVWDAFLEQQEAAGVEGHMLEIGVYKGRSAYFSSMFARAGEHCWFIDPELDPEFRRSVEQSMPGRAHCLERSSFEVGKSPEGHLDGFGEFRWIHVDGQHTARAVVNDLTLADRLLAPQGIVIVDDFLCSLWPHVAAGVFRFLQEQPGRLELVLTAFNKGYLVRPEAVESLQAFVREGLPAHLRSRRFDDFTLLECNLLDADDGIHCLGISSRVEGRGFIAYDNRIG